ncbi:MAG: TspO/MBR family protein, partial [Blastocatellia bacterium]
MEQTISLQQEKGNKHFISLLVFLTICFSVAGAGAVLTNTSVSSWYLTINKPSWTPPNWLFGPVWTSLYFMMALA